MLDSSIAGIPSEPSVLSQGDELEISIYICIYVYSSSNNNNNNKIIIIILIIVIIISSTYSRKA
jgi:hypothetical protein